MPPVALIVAAHGNLATGLLESSTMIAGTIEKATAITFSQSEGPDDLLAKYEAAVAEMDAPEVLFLVDLFGGSPYNAAARFVASRTGADIVTGVNLPMVIEVVGKRRPTTPLAKLVTTARQAALASVRVFSETFVPPTTSTEDEGDEL
jgi:mannose PTS system EIIA component